MNKKELNEIFKKHLIWLNYEPGGEIADLTRADLMGADLTRANLMEANLMEANLMGADLMEADLTRANLRGANLTRANLRGANLMEADLMKANLMKANLMEANLMEANLTRANLRGANLMEANLMGANLMKANLTRANLMGANLMGANLMGADLMKANLTRANLMGANLMGANLMGADLPHFQCIPEEGEFIAWKKAQLDGKSVLVKIKIPGDGKRTGNLINRKCRASKVIVVVCYFFQSQGLEIEEKIDVAYGLHDKKFEYRTGAIVIADSYNPDIRLDCTHGIHFFPTKKEAMEWDL